MIKSTTKIFKEKVRKYILECIGEDYLTECGYPINTDKEKIISVFKCMNDEWWKGYEKQRTPNRYEALKQYLFCLPSSFSTDFYYYNQRQIIKNWYEQTEEENNKFSDDKIADMFYYQISINFFQMYDKYIKEVTR